MVEELYIYDKDGVRQSVDLNTPSGITLKWVSNLFNSLDKVNCSYSYTFKIPMTRHNREVFDYAEDIRHTSGLLGIKVKAEFLQNGIPLFKNGNLYIDKSTSDGYSCVFTWDNLEGLQNLKDNGCSLNELRDALVKAGYESDELTDEGIVDWYVNWLRYDDSILNAFDNEKKILYPYYGVVYSDPNYSVYPKSTYIVGQGIPRPVIPVRYIINCINKAFGTTFNLGNHVKDEANLLETPISKWLTNGTNIIDYGVLPLVGKDLTDNQLSSLGKTLKFLGRKTGFWGLGVLGTYGILTFEKGSDYVFDFYGYEDKLDYLIYKIYDDDGKLSEWEFPSSLKVLAQYMATKDALTDDHYGCVGIVARFGCTIKMEGSFYIDLTTDYGTKITQDIYDKLNLKVYSWKTVNKGYTDEHIEKIEVASFGPVKIDDISLGISTKVYRVYFNFNESEGYESVTFCSDDSALLGTDAQEYWFGFASEVSGLSNFTCLTDFKFTPMINDFDTDAHKIDTFTNLPDIDCLTFMKSLFYMVGGFPYINSKGDIGEKMYSEIKENLSKGIVYNWSSNTIGKEGELDELSFNSSDFKRNNYYMNKWDDLDRTETELKNEDDVYEDGVGNIKVGNNTLDKEQTVHQTPFYPPYILNRNNPGQTDHTIKGVDYSPADNNYSVDDRGNIVNSNKAKYIEVKPTYGYVHHIPFFDNLKKNRIKPWSESTDHVRMNIFNPFKDILMNPSYRYLQEIVAHSFVITEKLLLNEFDLMDLDYAKPVYLEKYNSYFAIISIQRDSKGICKCQLIKLPTYKPPVKVTISIKEQNMVRILMNASSSVTEEDKIINIGIILESSAKGQYVQHASIRLRGDYSFAVVDPTLTSTTQDWVIKDVWLDHYEENDYNDYEFIVG